MGGSAYPTGLVEYPTYYAWNGTLPYTAGGTTSCVIARSPTLQTSTVTYTVNESSSTYTDSFSFEELLFAATPLPEITNLPTKPVYDLDTQDTKGWTYCLTWGDGFYIGEEFVSFYPGSVFDSIYHECVIQASAAGPASVVNAASFLLDETTTYV